jgi:hypothetical protein
MLPRHRGPARAEAKVIFRDTSAKGIKWERTPWHATQRAAWEALRKAEEGN